MEISKKDSDKFEGRIFNLFFGFKYQVINECEIVLICLLFEDFKEFQKFKFNVKIN